MLRPGLAALVALALLPAGASASPRAVIAFLPTAQSAPRLPALDRLDRREQLAIGFLGATQGAYRQTQALLDMTQGTRTSLSTYRPREAPQLGVVLRGRGAVIAGWQAAVRRADAAPADVVPGLLASSVPGGAGFAGVEGQPPLDALVAADRAGRVAEVSIGAAGTLAARTRRLVARRALVVADLPGGPAGGRALDALLATRAPDEVLLVVQAPPDLGSPRLLPAGAAGLGTGGTLTSSTTRRRGIFAGIDVLPTVLRHLGRPIPDTVRGQPIRTRPGRDAAALRRLEARLRVVLARRVPALRTLLLTWAGLLLALVAADRRRGLRRALRLGGLGIFWVPSVLLATAALAPGREVELALISAAAFALAILTDLLVGWPRGLAVPAVVGLAAYAADLAAGSPLIVRALLGPNPRSGSRYFGLGNELEAILPILLFVGLAAALPTLRRSRRGALTFALAGLALGVVAGSGRLGADVGAVITIGAGAATATVLMLPGGPTRRAVAIALLVPAAALVGLAALDLLTGGDSHFTRTVLHARSGGDLWDTISRRYELAYRNLVLGAMPVLTALSVGAVAWAVVRREDVLAPVRGSAAWRAGLAGALASCVAGTLFNDSGPLVLVFGVFMLLFATLYVRGVPPSPAPQVARGGAPASPAPIPAGSAARGID